MLLLRLTLSPLCVSKNQSLHFLFRFSFVGLEPVTNAEGQAMANTISAYKYIECSALTQDNLQEVFHETIRSVISPNANKEASKPAEVKGNKTSVKTDSKDKDKNKKAKSSKDKESKKTGGIFGKKTAK